MFKIVSANRYQILHTRTLQRERESMKQRSREKERERQIDKERGIFIDRYIDRQREREKESRAGTGPIQQLQFLNLCLKKPLHIRDFF